ncbi:MAG TPA: NBR1-Ig-like domain-containing protein [Anaerolineales bacterium]
MSARIIIGEMEALRGCKPFRAGRWKTALLSFLTFFAAACTPQATPTIFIPPTAAAAPTQAVTAIPASPTATLAPTATPVPPTPTPCTNNLSFVHDITVPDGTSVLPGELVDKQWLVTNTGSCNWDSSYRLKFLTGDAMGAPTEQALYPARAGAQATLRIVFHAPKDAGNYATAWQAVAPDGTAFGEAVYMQVNVTP